MIKEAILKVYQHQDLTYEEAYQTMDEIMNGEASEVQMSAYLTAMAISSLDALVTTMVSVFKPKIKNARIKIKPSYQSSEFIVSARLNIGIRVLDGIVAYIKARIVKQKGEQNA